jgi:hypothetical protein
MHTDKLIRSALLAGIFYPAEPEQLKSEVRMLAMQTGQMAHSGCAIISPHGSFRYSGPLAAKAWSSLVGANPSIIILAGPAHLPYEEGVFLPESSQFAIPGAVLNVDVNFAEYLLGRIPELKKNDLVHLEEHSIEMQLPFAEHFFPGVPILPIIISGRDEKTVATAEQLFEEMKVCVENQGVFVLSSDLAVSNTPEECDRLSNEFIAALSSGNTASFSVHDVSRHSFCGEPAIRAFIHVYSESKSRLLAYANSAPFREGTDEPVVGYGAISFSR